MNSITDFLKKKIMGVRKGSLQVHGDILPVNMTETLLKPKNILIIPYKRMGTVLLATRVFKAFREHFTDSKITVAVHNSWSVLIKNDPTIDEVITFGDFIDNPHSKEFKEIGKLLAERKFDVAFFLSYQFDLEISYLIRLSESKLRISFSGRDEHEYFNVGIVPAPGVRYEVDRYLEMLRTLGIQGTIRDYTMSINDSIKEKARMRFLPAGPIAKVGRIVGFDLTSEIVKNPISRKNAEQIIKTLISGLQATVVVFFEPGKTNLAAELKEVFGKDIILVEDRPVSMLAGMMSYCRFVVTHNTDLMQFAIALKTPTVAILTDDEATQWSPGENDHFIHLKCSDSSWPSSATILQAVKQILKKNKK